MPGAGSEGKRNNGNPKSRDPGPGLVSRLAEGGRLSLMTGTLRAGTCNPWDTQHRHRRQSPDAHTSGKEANTPPSQDSWIPVWPQWSLL